MSISCHARDCSGAPRAPEGPLTSARGAAAVRHGAPPASPAAGWTPRTPVLAGPGTGMRRIAIACTGQRSAQALQPVQAAASCSVARLRHCTACRLSTCGGHAPTHQPQPVQRAGSTVGSQPGRGGGAGRIDRWYRRRLRRPKGRTEEVRRARARVRARHGRRLSGVREAGGGERGIRTLGTGGPVRRISNPVHSTTLPSLRRGLRRSRSGAF